MGMLVTRGASLQSAMRDLVHRFTQERGIDSFVHLEGLGYEPTSKQKVAVMNRVTRKKNPIPFRDAWTSNFVGNKFGQATTHWSKLMDRVQRGVGNPCPLLMIGLPASMVTFEAVPIEMLGDDSPDPESEAG